MLIVRVAASSEKQLTLHLQSIQNTNEKMEYFVAARNGKRMANPAILLVVADLFLTK